MSVPEKVIGTTFSASILDGFSEFYNRTMGNLRNKTAVFHDRDQTYRIYQKFKNNPTMMNLLEMSPSTEEKVCPFALTMH